MAHALVRAASRLISTLVFVSLAQPHSYSLRVWRMEDGLPQNRIQAISQTPDGYLWIGTSGGLVRFDGVRFVVFDRSNTPAFRDDSVLALCASKDGALWIGTEGGGLLRHSGGVFQAFHSEHGLTNGFVRALREDRRGTLWAGTDRGFFRLDGNRLVRLDGDARIPFVAATAIYEDSHGRIWVSGARLLAVEENRLVEIPVDGGAHDARVRGVVEVDGTLLALVADRFFPILNGRVSASPRLGYPHTLNAFRPYLDHRQNLWIGAEGGGLIRFRDSHAETFTAPGALPDNTVLAIFEDRQRNLWIGTQSGLVRFSEKSVDTITAADGLSDDNVTTVYEDRAGLLWIADGAGRLFRLAGDRLSAVTLPLPAANLRVRTVFQDRSGAYWIGTASQGVIRWAAGKAVSYTTQHGLRQNTIRAFHQDRHGDIWIGTGSGLNRWDGSRFHSFYIEDGLAYGSVRAIAEDNNGDLWIGTDGGLSRMHQGNFVRDDALLKQLGSERVWAIHPDPAPDSAGALWFGTRGRGLFRIKNGKLANITTRHGLPNNNIYQILDDGHGKLWMSGPAGVFSINRGDLEAAADGKPDPLVVVLYGTADGMGSSQMNGGVQPAGAVSASGRLWFPSVKGLAGIDPNRVRARTDAPAVIEEITADERRIPLAGAVRVPRESRKLEIYYTATELLSPERISFKYILEGFDNTWTAASRRRVAYYTGLPPGRYRFRVIASDSASPEHTTEASLAFEWEPHFYQTRWFYLLCAALAALLAWTAFRIYVRQTRARLAVQFAERARLAREMHDTVIQDCVGISTLLEAASRFEQSDVSRMKELMNRARMQVRLTLEEARQAVWDLRQPSPARGLANALAQFAAQVSGERNIPVRTEVTGQPVRLDDRTDRNLLLVAREALRNAAAHARPREIDVRLCYDPSEVRLEVIDDGCGFEPPTHLSTINGHFGLVGMRERIEQLGGSLDVRSHSGQGTTVLVRLPVEGRRKSAGVGD